MLKELIIFTAGVAVGGAAVWFYQEHKYESLINEEVESVKKTFSKAAKVYDEVEEKVSDVSESLRDLAEKARNKASIEEIAQTEGYINYATPVAINAIDETKKEIEEIKEKVVIKKPYIIDQGDFREFDDYGHITMDYYTDGVLADADDPDSPIDDISSYVGDCLKKVNEERYDDWIYIRNEHKKVDIEIFVNDKPFSERED